MARHQMLSNDFSFLCASLVQFNLHLLILVVMVTQALFVKEAKIQAATNFQLGF